jgi:ubiquinone/menaquinone biosynthesis C-methylase UbiE
MIFESQALKGLDALCFRKVSMAELIAALNFWFGVYDRLRMRRKQFKIEAIPNFAAGFYSLIARKNPCIRDIHIEVAQDVAAQVSSGRILDIGTGPGYVPFEIARRAPGLEIIGIDLSSAMVEIANRNAKELGVSERVKFEVADAANLPFEPGYFDFVISTLSLHHWRNPAACIKEIHRVLKENGRVYIYDLRRDITKEAKLQLKKKYGWFLYFLFLKIVMFHSSITSSDAKEIIYSLEVNFAEKSVQEKDVILKLQMIK